VTGRENDSGGGAVEAVIGLVAAVGVLGLTGLFVATLRLLGAAVPPAVEVPEDDLLTWAATHPDRVHAPNSPAEEGL